MSDNQDYDDYEAKLLKQQQEFLQGGSKSSVSMVRGPPPPVAGKSSKFISATRPPSTKPNASTSTPTSTTNNGIPIIQEHVEKDVISLFDNTITSDNGATPMKIDATNITSTSRFKLKQQQQQQEEDQPKIEYSDETGDYVEYYDEQDQQGDHQNREEQEFDAERYMAQSDNHITNIISKIYERDVTDSIFEPPKKKVQGFPEAVHRSLQSFSKKSKTTPTSNNNNSNNDKNVSDIEKENIDKMSTMSQEEILEKQEYLLKHLDPKIIEMLKKKRQNLDNQPQQQQNKDVEMNDKQPQPQPQPSQPSQPNSKRKGVQFDLKNNTSNNKMQVDDDEKVEKENQQEKEFKEDIYDETTLWMKDLDSKDIVKQDFQENINNFREWRFDFNGNIIKRGSETPVHSGLHHHGEEASEAGYTIIELIHLIKSTNLSQKCIALKILDLILSKIHSNSYPVSISKNNELFKEILILKIPRLLRICIDSNVPSILSHSLGCMHSLLVPKIEEHAYEMIEYKSHRAYETISIKPMDPPKTFTNEEEEPEKGDDEKCYHDLIQGLIDMGILNRLTYLLNNESKTIDLSDPYQREYLNRIGLILDIFIRFTRHSENVANEFINANDIILELIQKHMSYLVTIQIFNQETSVFKQILIKCVRFLRRLSQASKHAAEIMSSSKFSIYQLVKSQINQCRDNQVLLEYIMLLRVWFIYKINIEDYFMDFLPVLSRYVLEFTEIINVEAFHLSKNTNLSNDDKEADTPIEFTPSFISVVDLHIIETVRSIYNLLDIMLPIVVADSTFYEPISNFIEPAFILLQTLPVIYHSLREKEVYSYQLLSVIGLFSSTIHFISTFFASLNRMLISPNQFTRLVTISQNLNQSLNQQQKPNQNLLDLVENNTNVIFGSIFGSTLYKDAKKKVLLSGASTTPLSKVNYQFFFEGEIYEWWLSVSRYLILNLEINRAIGKLIFYMDKCDFFLLLHSILVSTIDYRKVYLEKDRDLILSNNRSRNYLYFYLIKLMNELRYETEDFDPNFSKYHHSAAMALIPNFLPNEDTLVWELLNSTILQNDYLQAIGNLKPSSVSIVLLNFFQDRFFPSKTLQYSEILYRVDDSNNMLDNLLISFESDNSLLPLKYDWFNLPVEFLYQSSIGHYSGNSQNYFDENESDWDENMDSQPLISNTLLFIQSLYNTNSEYILSIPIENTYSTLLKVFLLKSEPWKNSDVAQLLKHLFNTTINVLNKKDDDEEEDQEQEPKEKVQKEFDFEGYFGPKFYQFFQDFLASFIFSSFASEIFSTFLWVYLRMVYHPKYRLHTWNELLPTLGYLAYPENQQLPLGDHGYLFPIEKDMEVLTIYKTALAKKKLNRTNSSKLYLIAIHHLSNFLFMDNGQPSVDSISKNYTKSDTFTNILEFSSKETIIDLLSYSYMKDCIYKFSDSNVEEITDEKKLFTKHFIQTNDKLKQRWESELNIF
ncbi:hypothetical protein CYY_007302 [Polysphondylium violaceum]|uniref:RNA polymerase II-associated protein 1 C-terminal domain-containing protein n=1 Tax=Polysphondylium violaceum TaxID=133409 RepID=A0A8J4UQZ3_9MYCE|nr:hypothetical protein CYY_007302 [Polysphondylium violaceum]